MRHPIKWRNSLIFDMHYVMAQESDEVKKETQALMGATRPASGEERGVCIYYALFRVAYCFLFSRRETRRPH